MSNFPITLLRRTAPLAALLGHAAAVAQTAAPQTQPPPTVITPPTSFSLPPSTPAPSPTATPPPTPTPTSVPSPAVAPPPVVRTADRPAPAASSTPPPATSLRRPAPAPAPTVRPSAVPIPVPTPISTVAPAPVPAAREGAAIGNDPPRADAAGPGIADWWPWAFALLLAIVALGAVVWRRATRGADRLDDVSPAPVALPPMPSPPAAPLTPPAPPARPAAPVPQAPPTVPRAPATHGIAIDIRPVALGVDATRALLDFEMAVANVGGSVAEGIRALVGITSAGPLLDQHLAAFAANASLAVATDAFTLAPGEARRIATRLELPREAMHVAGAGGRPMIVPVVMAVLRWRGGLSVRALAETHMVGTGDAGAARLGPIWVDGAARRYDRLAARRFTPSRS